MLYGYFVINCKGIDFIPPLVKVRLVNFLIITTIFAVLSLLGVPEEDNYGLLGAMLAGIFVSSIMPTIEHGSREKFLRIGFGLMGLIQLIATISIFYLANPVLESE